MKLISSGALFAIAATALMPTAAAASVTININEVGSDVVATGSGSLDLTDLVFIGDFGPAEGVLPSVAYIGTGLDTLSAAFTGLTGPTQFGPGGLTAFSSTTGTELGINGGAFASPVVFLPEGYGSGAPLSTSATWIGQSFASLGLTPGKYVYTSARDTFTINIGAVGGVPEPATWAMMLLGFGAIGWTVRRKRRTAETLSCTSTSSGPPSATAPSSARTLLGCS